MRYHEITTETITLETGARVIKNPTTDGLVSFLLRSQDKSLRGLTYGADVYWWDAAAAIHGDIAKEFVRGAQEQGGLITLDDLKNWHPKEEEPLHTNYKGIDVYKLSQWTQGPFLLQALNMLENIFDKNASNLMPVLLH